MSPKTEDARRAEPGGCGCAPPAAGTAATCYCTVDELVGAISRKHALSLVNFIGSRGTVRFHEMEEGIRGISSSTLSATLSQLSRVGLVAREVFPETPPRVEYGLTEAGETLRRRLRELLGEVQKGV